MVDSSKADMSPQQRRQAAFADNFSRRLWEALGGRKLKWLAEESGVSSSILSDYGKGSKVPGADKVVAIADALSVDVSWLLTGRNGSIADQLAAQADRQLNDVVSPDVVGRLAANMLGKQKPQQNHDSRQLGASNDDDIVEIDQIDLRYGLGGSYSDSHVEVAKRVFDRDWLRSITSTPPAQLAWATGEGDSMEPTIRSGEVVLIDTSADKRRFDDTIWAVMLGEIGMIKRLRSRSDVVELLSDNPLVPPQTAADGELHPVGRVVAVVRRL